MSERQTFLGVRTARCPQTLSNRMKAPNFSSWTRVHPASFGPERKTPEILQRHSLLRSISLGYELRSHSKTGRHSIAVCSNTLHTQCTDKHHKVPPPEIDRQGVAFAGKIRVDKKFHAFSSTIPYPSEKLYQNHVVNLMYIKICNAFCQCNCFGAC